MLNRCYNGVFISGHATVSGVVLALFVYYDAPFDPEFVHPLKDTAQVHVHKFKDERRQMGRWRAGTQGPSRRDSRFIV